MTTPGGNPIRVNAASAHTHAELFDEYNLADACALELQVRRPDLGMRGAATPSADLLCGLTRDLLTIDQVVLESHRPMLTKALHAEHDAELFCRELNRRAAADQLTLGPSFAAFEALWRRDELDHTIGFIRLYAVLYGSDEGTVLETLRSRSADFARLEPFLGDELSVCLLLAYDELATTLSYAADRRDFYPRLGDDRVIKWITRLAADEARHYGNLVRVMTTAHRHELHRAPAILDALCALDLTRPEYRGTFVLDHDDPAVFPAEQLEECRRRVLRSIGFDAGRA